MSSYEIAVLGGDGIGPEITRLAIDVVNAAIERAGGFELEYTTVDASVRQWQRTGSAMTSEQFETCRDAHAILFGAIGLPGVLHPDGTEVSGDVMFGLRFGLDLFAGLRPVKTYPGVPSLLARGEGIDYVVVRESVEGLFASRGAGVNVRDEVVIDQLVITRNGTQKVVRRAFELARQRAERLGRPGKVTCVDKANVFASYAFFRKVFDEVAREFPDVASDHVFVDAMTLYQVQSPQQFDVVVTENMFGDIITDLSAATIGGLGLAASGDIGNDHGLFQPAHGSAPALAGKDVANPVAAILSAAMMLDWLAARHDDPAMAKAAQQIVRATEASLTSPATRTADLGGSAGSSQVAAAIVAALDAGES